MPHQCLQCGHAFEEGSSALLQGCPDCKGTRFFYSAEAVTEDERKALATKAKKDMRDVIADVLQEAAPDIAEELKDKADGDGWADLKPSDLRKIIKKVKDQAPEDDATPIDPAAKARLDEVKAAIAEQDDAPEKVSIEEAGSYKIDVKGLMEKNPLVVHRDGAYSIHLPSLFDKKE